MHLIIPSEYSRKPVTVIGNYAFRRSLIKDVTIPDTIERIEEGAFTQPTSWLPPVYCFSSSILERVSFGRRSRLNYIGDAAFWGNIKLKEFRIPKDVTYLGTWALGTCAFTRMEIPEKVETIACGAFAQSLNLKYIKVDKNNKYYKDKDGVVYNTDETILVSYPFDKEDYCYSVPATVREIYDCCNFWGTKNLRVLYMNSLQPPTANLTFDTAEKAFKIYVPSQSYEVYCNADGWKDNFSK
jgi:hypothetical protein